jgi:transcriptional regulator with XRE-family HTH domain
VGVATYGSRRVPGLRREEVAVLAGVSVPYYTRIERGDLNGVSESVLEALARALHLDEAERAHLFDLARALNPTTRPRRRRAAKQPVRHSVEHLLDALTGAPALVHNARLDSLAANQLGYALYCDMFTRAAGPGPINSARYVFLDPGARDFYIDWNRAAGDVASTTPAPRTPPPRRRRDHPHLQPRRAARRSRPDNHDVRRRARIQVRQSAQPPRRLGRDA